MKRISIVLCLLLVFCVGMLAETSPVGKWKLYSDWDCDEEKDGVTYITFKLDNTFVDEDGNKGTWELFAENGIFWKYDTSGNKNGTEYKGTFSTGFKGNGTMKSGKNDCTGRWNFDRIVGKR